MKITDTHISIPPYISTAWENISSIHAEGSSVVFSLIDGAEVSVPNLSKEEIDEIFTNHLHFLEHEKQHSQIPFSFESLLKSSPAINFGDMESIGDALAHNPKNAHLPPLPEPMIKKIQSLAEMMGEEELELLTPPEPNCNCLYCQITRILRGEKNDVKTIEAEIEEPVSEEELRFEEWTVENISDKMYRVINKLDKNESYSVYLGEPIGCTCGKNNCEHVIAALRS